MSDLVGVTDYLIKASPLLAITLIPAIKSAWSAQKQAGRAEAYKDETDKTIGTLKAEIAKLESRPPRCAECPWWERERRT